MKHVITKEKWGNGQFVSRWNRNTGRVEPSLHPKGYCGDQLCCWGQPKDKVQWPKKKQ